MLSRVSRSEMLWGEVCHLWTRQTFSLCLLSFFFSVCQPSHLLSTRNWINLFIKMSKYLFRKASHLGCYKECLLARVSLINSVRLMSDVWWSAGRVSSDWLWCWMQLELQSQVHSDRIYFSQQRHREPLLHVLSDAVTVTRPVCSVNVLPDQLSLWNQTLSLLFKLWKVEKIRLINRIRKIVLFLSPQYFLCAKLKISEQQ